MNNRDGMPKKRNPNPIPDRQELLQGIFEGLDDALFVVDSKTRTILDCNPAVEKIFGYLPEEIIGHTTVLLHLNRRMFLQFDKMSLPALEEKGVFRTEYRMRRRDGSVFISEHAIIRVTQPGRPLVVTSLVRDVTEGWRVKNLLQVQMALALALAETSSLTEALHLSLEAAMKVAGLECGGIISVMIKTIPCGWRATGDCPPPLCGRRPGMRRIREMPCWSCKAGPYTAATPI